MTMRIPALMAAVALVALSPKVHAAACHCTRAPHHPSTAREHAETERLNREFRAVSQAFAAPPQRAAENAPRPTAYQSELDQYRALRDGYDRRLRDYNRAVPPPQATARMQLPPAAAVSGNEIGLQDRNRLNPWHGYNPHDGLSNGY